MSTPRIEPWWQSPATWAVVPVLVALDQWTKHYIVTYYYLHEVTSVLGEVVRLTRVHNQGAAFGVLQEWPDLFKYLTGFAIVALIAHKILTSNRTLLYHSALSLILSGAIGNFIDRIRYNHVVDFLQIGAYGWYWPSFNVADSAITCGVALLLWGSFTGEGRETTEALALSARPTAREPKSGDPPRSVGVRADP